MSFHYETRSGYHYLGHFDGEEGCTLYSRRAADHIADVTMGEGDARAMRRAIRRSRIVLGRPMRIRVHVFTEQTRHGYGGGDYAPMYDDTCEVYGWRAALTAIRAMRAEMPEGWRTLHLTDDPVLSARVREALDLPADDEPSRLCCGRYIG